MGGGVSFSMTIKSVCQALTVVILLGVSGCHFSSGVHYLSLSEVEIRDLVKTGMMKSEVKDLLGQPYEIEDEIWFYFNREPFSENRDYPKHFSIWFSNDAVETLSVSYGK
jgi:hypothetical protein